MNEAQIMQLFNELSCPQNVLKMGSAKDLASSHAFQINFTVVLHKNFVCSIPTFVVDESWEPNVDVMNGLKHSELYFIKLSLRLTMVAFENHQVLWGLLALNELNLSMFVGLKCFQGHLRLKCITDH